MKTANLPECQMSDAKNQSTREPCLVSEGRRAARKSFIFFLSIVLLWLNNNVPIYETPYGLWRTDEQKQKHELQSVIGPLL